MLPDVGRLVRVLAPAEERRRRYQRRVRPDAHHQQRGGRVVQVARLERLADHHVTLERQHRQRHYRRYACKLKQISELVLNRTN